MRPRRGHQRRRGGHGRPSLRLYGLTEEESTAIERQLSLVHASDEAEDAGLVRAIEEGLEEGHADREEVMVLLRDRDGD